VISHRTVSGNLKMDLRTRKLAKLVVDYALSVKPEENVMISGGVESQEFIVALYKEIILRGAHPMTRVGLPDLSQFFYKYANKSQLEKFPAIYDYTIKRVQKFIGISSSTNTRELSNCDPKKIAVRRKITHPINEYICNGKPDIQRSTVAFPCFALAQEAEMSLAEYENFVFEACLQDWKKVGKHMKKVLKTFQKGKQVQLVGEGVDLRFKIHGEKAKSDLDGENIPMGEVFMAPLRDSVNGWINFDYPAIEGGKEVTDICLKFKNGKVIEAKASKNEEFLKEMLAADENASYLGEFGIGMNSKVTKFTKNLLFDEKMGGTIHLALGAAYKENGGGNDSAIHWDIVKDMNKAKIILDGKVVQENGNWKI
jgi:aminopeptidase